MRKEVAAQPAQQEPVAELLKQSRKNFDHNFGKAGQGWADWIYADLLELLTTPPAAAQPALVVAAQKVMEEFGTASDSLQELYQTLKLYTTQPAAQPEREPVTVAIEHCLSARNERTPCPHTVSTPSAVMADLKWAVTELEALDDATVQFVLDVLRKHLVAGSFTPAQPAQPEIAPDYWLGYGLQAHTEKPFEGATPVWTSPPAQRQPLTDDPLQGAVDWLLQADGEYFCTALVQRTLRIGYNRAKRLYDTAKERAEAAHGIKE